MFKLLETQKNKNIIQKVCFYLLTILAFMLLFSHQSFAQIGISLYPINSEIGLKTSNLKPFSFELRTNYDISHSTNDLLYAIQPDINFIYRIKKEERLNFYMGLGAGCGLNNVSGSFKSTALLTGLEFYPVASMRNLTITVELDPTARFYSEYQSIKLTGWLGVSYYFKKSAHAKEN